jgi:hypothetical protein
MEGLLDPFDFVLAEHLGMTVAHMRASMSNAEFVEWRAFYKWRDAMQKLAAK